MPARKKPESTSQERDAGLQSAVAVLQEAVDVMRNALFGFWDEEKLQEVPGFNTRLGSVETKMIWLQRFVVWFGGPALTFILAKALGAPTEAIGQSLANHVSFWGYLLQQH